MVKSSLDPLQFSYQPHLGKDDVIIYLLQLTHSHLDGTDFTVRIIFFEFTSAFNTYPATATEGEATPSTGLPTT